MCEVVLGICWFVANGGYGGSAVRGVPENCFGHFSTMELHGDSGPLIPFQMWESIRVSLRVVLGATLGREEGQFNRFNRI